MTDHDNNATTNDDTDSTPTPAGMAIMQRVIDVGITMSPGEAAMNIGTLISALLSQELEGDDAEEDAKFIEAKLIAVAMAVAALVHLHESTEAIRRHNIALADECIINIQNKGVRLLDIYKAGVQAFYGIGEEG